MRTSTRRKASEISKAELVGMIAKLRGVLYLLGDDHYDSSNLEEHKHEIEEVLDETTFDDDLNSSYSTITPKHPVKRLGMSLLDGLEQYDMPPTKIIEENSIRDIEDKEDELGSIPCVPEYGAVFEMKPPKLTSIDTRHIPGKGTVKIVPFNDYLILKSRELGGKVLIIDDEEWTVRDGGIEYFRKEKGSNLGLLVRKWKCEHGYQYGECPWPITNDPDACEYAHRNAFMDLEKEPDVVDQLASAYVGSVRIYPKVRMRRVHNECGGRLERWSWEFHCELRPIIDDQGNIVEWKEKSSGTQ